MPAKSPARSRAAPRARSPGGPRAPRRADPVADDARPARAALRTAPPHVGDRPSASPRVAAAGSQANANAASGARTAAGRAPRTTWTEPVWLVRAVLVLFLVGFAAFLARELRNFLSWLP